MRKPTHRQKERLQRLSEHIQKLRDAQLSLRRFKGYEDVSRKVGDVWVDATSQWMEELFEVHGCK